MLSWMFRSKKEPEEVIVKLQRPMAGHMGDVLSYIVDEDGEMSSNPVLTPTNEEDMDTLFGEYWEVYWKGYYQKDQPIVLLEPCWEDEWV